MDVFEARRCRLRGQLLTGSALADPVEVLRWMVAVQGQDYLGAKWSLGLRLPGITDAAVEQAFAERRIVRTWAMRGTLQFAAAADVRGLVALLAPRIIAGNARRFRELELDESTLTRSCDILARALEGGQQRSRRDLLAVLRQNGISTEGQRGVYLLQRASLEGLIYQGAQVRGVQQYYAADALPAAAMADREAALAELAWGYFRSRGPASLGDFAWWSGLAAGEARAALEAVKNRLERQTLDGKETWLAEMGCPEGQGQLDAALLPIYDEYLLSYSDRSAGYDGQEALLLPPGYGVLPQTIVIDGRVRGTWKRSIQKRGVLIEERLFASLGPAEEEALGRARVKYSEFLGLPLAEG